MEAIARDTPGAINREQGVGGREQEKSPYLKAGDLYKDVFGSRAMRLETNYFLFSIPEGRGFKP